MLEHIIEHSKYYTDLDDMRVLVGNTRNAATDDDDDEDGEDNFFQSINHIQLHRRQKSSENYVTIKMI